MIEVIAITGALGWLARRRRQAAAAAEPRNINSLVPSPDVEAAYWAAAATGAPEPGLERAPGLVQPQGSPLTPWSLFRPRLALWRAPGAVTGASLALPFAPPGLTILPGPIPPGQPGPQSAVEPRSPWLPVDFAFAHPMAVNRWFWQASESDPLSLWLYGADFIDTTDAALAPPERA